MEHRKWDSRKKLEIVIEGLKAVNLSEVCNKHQISQGQYYKWRDQLLEHGQEIFEFKRKDREVEDLKAQTIRLKAIIGDLTTELKKNDF